MKREIWSSQNEEDNKKDSLYVATEILREYAKSNKKEGSLDYTLETLYSKLEKIRKEIESE
jgi:hypothetical protein